MVTIKELAGYAYEATACVVEAVDGDGLPEIYNLSVRVDDKSKVVTVHVLLSPNGRNELDKIDAIREWADYLGGDVHLGDPFPSQGQTLRGLNAVTDRGSARIEVETYLTMPDPVPAVLSHAA